NELGGDQHLIDAAGIEQPSIQHDRPLERPGELAVRGRESGPRGRAAVQREPEGDREHAQCTDLGQGTDLSPVEAGWFGNTTAVAGSVRAHSRLNALWPRRAPAAAARTVAVARATSNARTSSERQRRRESRRSQVSVIR